MSAAAPRLSFQGEPLTTLDNNTNEDDTNWDAVLAAPGYGFPAEEHQAEAAAGYFAALGDFLSAQQRAWDAYLAQQRADLERYQAGASFLHDDELLARIRSWGVPAQYRLRSWMRMSGAALSREAHPALFDELLAHTRPSPSLSPDSRSVLASGGEVSPDYQIDLDVQRTFPGHPYFESAAGRSALRRVLVAYSRLDPVIGYCQGMNFLAGTLLLVSGGDSDSAFFLFVALMDVVRPHFATSMVANKAAVRTLDRLIERLLPAVHDRLASVAGGTDLLSLVCLPWWLGFFATTLQLELALIVWDSLWTDAVHCDAPVYAACLAIFDLYAADLLADATDLHAFVAAFREPRWTGYLSNRCADFVQRFAAYLAQLQQPAAGLAALHAAALAEARADSERLSVNRELLQLARRTKFTRPQLERLMQQFDALAETTGDDCQEKGISLAVFQQVVPRVLPQWHSDADLLRHFFQLLDQSGDGMISFRELMVGLSVLYAGTEEEKLQLVFQLYDKDNSGAIDENELFQLVAFIYRASYARDADRDAVHSLFLALDTNGDGTISVDELRQIVKLFPGMLQFFRLENPAARAARKKTAATWFRKFRKQQRATMHNRTLTVDDLFAVDTVRRRPDSARHQHHQPSLREQVSHPLRQHTDNENTPLVAPVTPQPSCHVCIMM